jgi:epoxide hydrolase
MATQKNNQIEPFHLAIPDAALDDLRERLARTRLPEQETVEDSRQVVPLILTHG